MSNQERLNNIKQQTILLVEDQTELWPVVKDHLRDSCASLVFAPDLSSAYSHLRREVFDLILLDLCLGDDHGTDVLEFVRKQSQTVPIIILSSLSGLSSRKKCFELGADDYLIKPFNPQELVMRVERALVRSQTQPEPGLMASEIQVGTLRLSLADRSLQSDSSSSTLRAKLYDIMLLFMQNPGVTIKKELFCTIVWKDEAVDENSLAVHVHQLRKILKDMDETSVSIVTIPKLGYRLETSA